MSSRFGVNLLWMTPGVVGGSEDFATGLLRAMADHIDDDELVAFVNGRFADAHPDLSSRVRTVVGPVSGANRVARVVAENTWLQSMARREDVALVHHVGGTMPVRRARPGVLTIHDLQPLLMPENFSRLKQSYLRRALPRSAGHAAAVTTLTDFTRQAVIDRLGVETERASVVPYAVDVPGDVTLARQPALEVRARYGLGDRPLFVYPAITYPHKNHLFLIEVFAALSKRRPEALLVLPGGPGPVEGQVMEALRRRGVWKQVHRLGRIPRADLDTLFSEACALLFPSSFEGFGLPVLEAMAWGCPVVVADATALPEVVGGAGLRLPVGDRTAWVSAVERLLDDPTERGRLRALGRARAAEFDWPTVAEGMLAVYQEVAADGGGES